MDDVLKAGVLKDYTISLAEPKAVVNLMNRRKIWTECTEFCDGFRFGKNAVDLLANYD